MFQKKTNNRKFFLHIKFIYFKQLNYIAYSNSLSVRLINESCVIKYTLCKKTDTLPKYEILRKCDEFL